MDSNLFKELRYNLKAGKLKAGQNLPSDLVNYYLDKNNQNEKDDIFRKERQRLVFYERWLRNTFPDIDVRLNASTETLVIKF